MSVEAIGAVFRQSLAESTDRLVMLVLANSVNEETGHVWLSVERIGERARLSKRAVQYSLRRLEEIGELVHVGEHPKWRTRVYKLTPGGCNRLQGADPAPVHRSVNEGAPACTQSQENPRVETSPNGEGKNGAEVRQVFEHWQKVIGKPRHSLTPERRKKIQARLGQRIPPDRLCRAIDGLALSDFHMGRHPKTAKNPPNDIKHVFRDASTVEQFEELAEKAAPASEKWAEFDRLNDQLIEGKVKVNA